MSDAFILSAVRTPIGRVKGPLAAIHPADLGALVLAEAVNRAGVDPARVDDVVMGCVNGTGAQGGCLARTAWLSAGLPIEVPGVTIDRQCGSSQQALHFAAQAVRSGDQDLVVVGGIEQMAAVPIDINARVNRDLGTDKYGAGWNARFGEQQISQFRGAQLIAEKWGLSRDVLDGYALESHRRAVRAADLNLDGDSLVPVQGLLRDEGPRRDTSQGKLAALEPLRPGWVVTAGTASPLSIGAAALVVASERMVAELRVAPLARIGATAAVGSDPVLMLTGPIPATRKVLDRASMTVDDVDIFEVNEAFAPVVLAWMAETGVSHDVTNVNGGAIAHGHPLGATGAVLATKIIHELRRTGQRRGLQVMCEGGGQANATLIENV